ncbi:MAG: winged helix-turn-helix domain-containing protein [Oscillospiraceae bacterium]
MWRLAGPSGAFHRPHPVLTAKTQLGDKASAYASGGDDFLAKALFPVGASHEGGFSAPPIRVYKGKREEVLDASLHLDEDRCCAVKMAGWWSSPARNTTFSNTFPAPGKVLDVRSVYEGAWGEKYMPTSTNTVMVHILNLRKKLEEDPTNPKLIRTIWGKGYQFG